MPKIAAPAILVLLALCAGAASAEDWADNHDSFASGPEFAQSKAVCRGLKGQKPPPTDLPSPAVMASLKGCNAGALYYGHGVKADPVKARQCAFAQVAVGQGTDDAFSGEALLMTVYANGAGVTRNLDLATHYACRLDGAPMEQDGRVRNLQALKAKHWQGHDFDFCNDVTSGLAMGHCAGNEAEGVDARRKTGLDAMAAGFTPQQRAAFQALRQAEHDYVDAHSRDEIDLSGSARGAQSIEEAEAQDKVFADTLRRLEGDRLPYATPARLKAADTALNTAYQAVQRGGPDSSMEGVSRESVRETQRAWLRYRDAFIGFARLRRPELANGLAAWLTKDRTDIVAALAR